jgi:predicted MFS family arabinose efflux permease
MVYYCWSSLYFRLALMNLSNPIYQTFVLEQVPEETQALTMSLNSISFQFGWFVMPQLSGILQVQYGDLGFMAIFFLVALFYVTATSFEWWFFLKRKGLALVNIKSVTQSDSHEYLPDEHGD